MQPESLRTSSEDLLRRTRQVKQALQAFQSSGRAVMKPLSRTISRDENEAMETPRANIVGTLENLFNQDLPDVFRQLDELDECLRADGVAAP